MDYKYGKKNNWRRWQWNKICELLNWYGAKPKDAKVLYLVGDDNLDFDEIKRRKFNLRNVVGIEIDEKKANSNRGESSIICNDLSRIIMAGGRQSFDVIVADFCCGITENVKRFVDALIWNGSINTPCVIAVNLLRGRDAASNDFRDLINAQYAEYSLMYEGEEPKTINKHRGKQFYRYLDWMLAGYIHKTTYDRAMRLLENTKSNHKMIDDISSRKAHGLSLLLRGNAMCQHATYKNKRNNCYFDSVVFRWLNVNSIYPIFTWGNHFAPRFFTNRNEHIKAKRQIRAAKAINTMRYG